MFTGIVEEKGNVRGVSVSGPWGRLTIGASTVLEGTREGDSIAVNGVCLTVTRLARGEFTADVMAETMRRTNLGLLRHGDQVNLERAMAAGGRFGGHIVSGHVDGTGTILNMAREGNAVWITIEAPAAVAELIVEKGSITIDGISLTVAEAGGRAFCVSVIPHTGSETTLLAKRAGDTVNLESDIIGKYVKKLLSGSEASATEAGGAPGFTPAGETTGKASAPGETAGGVRGGITLDFLKTNGF